jgi:hypothetical protein
MKCQENDWGGNESLSAELRQAPFRRGESLRFAAAWNASRPIPN